MPPHSKLRVEHSPPPLTSTAKRDAHALSSAAQNVLKPCALTAAEIGQRWLKHFTGETTQEAEGFKATKIAELPAGLQERYATTPALENMLDGKYRCVYCGCNQEEHGKGTTNSGAEDAPKKSQLEILRESEENCIQDVRQLDQKWLFCSPLATESQGLEKMRKQFSEAESEILATLRNELQQQPDEPVTKCEKRTWTSTTNSNSPNDRAPLLIGITAGMGIGKSHCLDKVDKLVFQHATERPLVLKMTFNKNQQFSMDDEQQCVGGQIKARLAMAVKKKIPPDSNDVVRRMISTGSSLSNDELAKYIIEHAGKRQVVLAVDEIGVFSQSETVLRNALQALTSVMLTLSAMGTESIGVVTALPDVNIKSASHRRLKILRPYLLTHTESIHLLHSVLAQATTPERAKSYTENHIQQVVTFCGGHPRALVAAAQLMKSKGACKTVPHPQLVAEMCGWKTMQGVSSEDILHFITSTYKGQSPPASFDKNMVFTARNSVMIPPVLLFAPEHSIRPLHHVQRMFEHESGQSAAIALEQVHYRWDCFRCQHDLPVVPPLFPIHGKGSSSVFHSLRYCFSWQGPPCSKSVFYNNPKRINMSLFCDKSHKGSAPKIEETTYYKPSSANHFAFESMCVGKLANGERVLCLFQSKINDSFEAARNKLDEAADMIRKEKLWSGRFLFIILALEFNARRVPAKLKNPILLVTKEELHHYFTETLAPAVDIQRLAHKRK